MLTRLSESQINGEKRKKKKNSCKLWMVGLTTEEIEEQQRKLFEKVGQFEESEDVYNNEATEETPSAHAEVSAADVS